MAGRPAKKATKKSAAKTPKTTSKAGLVKKLKAAGLSVPEGAAVKDMQHRLKYYTDEDTAGYNVRLYRGWGSQYETHPLSLLSNRKAIYWLPPSDMADMIIKTRLVVVIKRGLPLNNALIIDVPVDYEAMYNGSDNSADS